MTLPFFEIHEDWDKRGNIDIWFARNITPGVQEHLANKLAEKVPHVSADERNTYHLSGLVSEVFTDMIDSNEIKHNPETKTWVLA